jgi:hypothetical protein
MTSFSAVPLSQYQYPTNGKQPVILGPKGTPYVTPPTITTASLGIVHKPMPAMVMPPAMFDDNNNNPGLMMFQNHGGYDYSNEHMGGDSSHHP